MQRACNGSRLLKSVVSKSKKQDRCFPSLVLGEKFALEEALERVLTPEVMFLFLWKKLEKKRKENG